MESPDDVIPDGDEIPLNHMKLNYYPGCNHS
jgi:hypothetical protein